MDFFQTGKLPPEVLQKMLGQIPVKDPRIVVGAKLGEDAAVIDMGDRYLVAKTDPITFTEERIGWYSVNVNANDIATMGAEPKWFLATLLLPEERSDMHLAETIFKDIISACEDLGVTLCGGHTEITHDLRRPIVVGQMLGEVSRERLVACHQIRPGDDILLTQGIAIEGTAILAREKTDILRTKIDIKEIERARTFLDDPGLSVVRAARIACDTAEIHGMHDPTEGGFATGLWEMTQACGCGFEVDAEAVSIYPETQNICSVLNLDPWGLIASGALLIVLPDKGSQAVITALDEEDIPCRRIGKVLEKGDSSTLTFRNTSKPLKPFVRDELTKIFG
jgi:hydrogenase expression/formation protein HypE